MTVCKLYTPRSRQITMPVPPQWVFKGQIPFLPPNQQHQSTEGLCMKCCNYALIEYLGLQGRLKWEVVVPWTRTTKEPSVDPTSRWSEYKCTVYSKHYNMQLNLHCFLLWKLWSSKWCLFKVTLSMSALCFQSCCYFVQHSITYICRMRTCT